jgi:Hemolysin coregulated protein Hcp (TssD)
MPASSFDAYFSWQGGPSGDGLAVVSCSYSLSQSIDDKGRVSSKVYGGTVHIQVDSSNEDHSKSIWEWMVQPDKTVSTAKITFKNIDSGQDLKTIDLKEVYCVQYSESFTESGSSSMTTSLTLSAQEIIMHNVPHKNRW